MDSTWIYDNSEVLLAIPLRASVKAAWQTIESDEEVPAPAKKPKDAKDAKDPKPTDDDAKPADPKPADDDAKPADGDDAKPTPAPETPPVVATEVKTDAPVVTPEKPKRKGFVIEFDNIESRAVRVPGAIRGAFGNLAVNDKGLLIYTRRGDNGGIKIIDAREKKPTEKVLTTGGGFIITADGKKILVPEGANARIVDAAAGGASKPVVTKPMMVDVDPRTEWRQMVGDAWLVFRDFFYDPNMHHVDWLSLIHI